MERALTTEAPKRRWAVVGSLGGVAITAGLVVAARVALSSLWGLPILFAVAGYAVDEQNRRAAHLVRSAELRNALASLTREADETRREFSALVERQRVRVGDVENELEESTAELQRTLTELDRGGPDGQGLLRAVSDGMPPLEVLRRQTDAIRRAHETGAAIDGAIVDEQLVALEKLEQVLGALGELVWSRENARPITLRRHDVRALANRIARRLRAFGLGWGTRVEVTVDASVPDEIETDASVLDLLLDALLSQVVENVGTGPIRVEVVRRDPYVAVSIERPGSTFGGEAPLFEKLARVLETLRAKLEIEARGDGVASSVFVPVEYESAPIVARHDLVARRAR